MAIERSLFPKGQAWFNERKNAAGYHYAPFSCYGFAWTAVVFILCLNDHQLLDFTRILKEMYSISPQDFRKKKFSTEIYSFLDTVSIFHQSDYFSRLFDMEPKLMVTQDALRMLPFVLSDSFLKAQVSKEVLINTIDSFSNTYNRGSLVWYLATLEKTINDMQEEHAVFDRPIVLMLSSGGHRISLSFNLHAKEWLFIDIEHGLPQSFKTHTDLALTLLQALSANKDTVFTTQIMGRPEDAALLEELANRWKNHPIMIEYILRVTKDKLKRVDSSDRNLIIRAAGQGEGDSNIIDTLLALAASDKQALPKEWQLYMQDALWAACFGNHLTIVEKLLQAGVNDKNSVYKNLSLLAYTAFIGQYDIVNLLLAYGANPDQVFKTSLSELEDINHCLGYTNKMKEFLYSRYSHRDVNFFKKNSTTKQISLTALDMAIIADEQKIADRLKNASKAKQLRLFSLDRDSQKEFPPLTRETQYASRRTWR